MLPRCKATLLALALIFPIVSPNSARADEIKSLKAVGGHNSPILSLALSKDGKLLASESLDRMVRLWNAEQWKPQATLSAITGGNTGQGGVSVAISPDSKYLVAPGYRGILVWTIDDKLKTKEPTKRHLDDMKNNVCAVGFNSDGKLVAPTGQDDAINIWDVSNGTHLKGTPLSKLPNYFNNVAMSRDGNLLAYTEGSFGEPLLFDVPKQKRVGSPVRKGLEVTSFAFSPDKKMLVMGEGKYNEKTMTWSTGRLRFVDLVKDGDKLGKETGTPKECPVAVRATTFTGDGKLLAVGDTDGLITLYEAATWKPVHTLKGHTAAVRCIVAEADGTRLISAGEDKSIRVWELPKVG